jgi:PAS domain S-box-containing protein
LYFSPQDREILLRSLDRQDRFDASELTVRAKSGEARTFLVSCRRMREGDKDWLFTLFVDVTARKRIELSLRESEERYRRIFCESSDPIAVIEWDPAAGFVRPVEVNDSLVQLLGYSRSELLSMTVTQWEGSHNRVSTSALVAQLQRERAITFERILETADGRRCIVEIRCGLIQWHGQELALAHLRDITARRQIEETLRLNETSLRVALTATNVALFRTDRCLRVTWAFNPSQGYFTTPATDAPPRAHSPSDHSRIGRLLDRVMRSGVGARDEVNLLREGTVRVHEMVVEPLKDESGVPAGVTAAVIDISARKKAENELRAALQRFELLTEAAPVGIFRADAKGNVTHANRAAQQITGRSLDELRQLHVTTLVHADDQPAAQASWQQVLEGTAETGRELRIVRPDGRLRWLFAQVRPIFAGRQFEQAVGSITDITEHRHFHEMHHALVIAGSRPGSFLANCLAQVTVQLSADFGCIVLPGEDPSRRTLRVLWRENAVAENLSETAAACPCLELLDQTTHVIAEGLAQHAPATVATWARGCEAAIVVPLPGPNQQPVGHLCLLWREPLRDEQMTLRLVQLVVLPFAAEIARETATAERRQLERQLLQSQKFEALGALAGGIAHDFNNILTAILNNAVLARGARHASPEQREICLDEIILAAQRASELVRQILGFGRGERSDATAERTVVNLRSIVADALRFLRPSTSPSITLEPFYDPAAPLVRAQMIQMHQVLMNLCVNAAQAIGDRVGRIGLRVERFVLDEITATGLPPLPLGLYARISVEDSGPGMSPEVMKRVFEPFFTTKSDNGGTGLGLALVQRIVADHGGAVTIESTLGQGSRFTVYLPAEEAPPVVEQTPADAPVFRGHGEHLLLVDDDGQVTASYRMLLTELGYRISGFEDPAKALAAFWADPSQFDAALIDYRMPKMNGTELAEYLSRTRPDVPIALLSGYPGELDQQRLSECGGSVLLTKPLSYTELATAIDTLLRRRSR